MGPQSLSQPQTPTLGLRMSFLLLQPWCQAVWATQPEGWLVTVAAPGPPHHATVDIGVKSTERTVPHAKCALGAVCLQSEMRTVKSIKRHFWPEADQRSILQKGQEISIWKRKRENGKEEKSKWSGFCCFLLVLHTLYLIRNIFHSYQNTPVNQYKSSQFKRFHLLSLCFLP